MCLSGRRYVREGWLNVVPPEGTGAKPKMFFLFSDMLLQAKRCSTLLPSTGARFVGQCAYPLQDCTVDKVFGHTRSQGGLLSVSQSSQPLWPTSHCSPVSVPPGLVKTDFMGHKSTCACSCNRYWANSFVTAATSVRQRLLAPSL